MVGDSGGYSGALTYNGGSGADVIDLGEAIASASGSLALNLGDGPNTVVVGSWFADVNGSVSIVGGNDTDVVTIGHSAGFSSTGTISLGAGADSVIIGNNVKFQSLEIDLENDGDMDTITFEGSVDPADTGSLIIQNFVIGDDTIVLEAATSTASVSLSTSGPDTLVTTATSNIYFTISNQTANALSLSTPGGVVEIS